MTQFVLEMYASRDDSRALADRIERLRRVAEESTGRGAPVRYVRRVFLPGDETCLLLCEAGSAEAVRAVAERADVPFERIVEAVAEPNANISSPEGD
jgi:hypothetical protein